MKFMSLNDASDVVSFEVALQKGIASDGGLYVPQSMPKLSDDHIKDLIGADRYAIAEAMLGPWLYGEIPAADLRGIIERAASFETPLVSVGDRHILELFHGPTMAFKDVAARYLAEFMSYFNQKAGRRSTVLVATSGDTGGAIAHGFANVPSLDLIILYPKGRVSALQLDQLRRVAKNVRSLEVNGTFDDCQALVKFAFADNALAEQYNLTSANSINIGRLLPQSTYYASVYAQLGQPVDRIVVPTGNMGNIAAGLIARNMGVPIKSFVAANNTNDAVVRYLLEGDYERTPTEATLSNAMDVSAPNNLPRLQHFLGGNIDNIRSVVSGVRVSDDETITIIKQVYADTGYLLDPHTAVGWKASQPGDVIIATASPLKFAEEITSATGIAVDNEAELKLLRQAAERYWPLEASLEALKQFMEHPNEPAE